MLAGQKSEARGQKSAGPASDLRHLPSDLIPQSAPAAFRSGETVSPTADVPAAASGCEVLPRAAASSKSRAAGSGNSKKHRERRPLQAARFLPRLQLLLGSALPVLFQRTDGLAVKHSRGRSASRALVWLPPSQTRPGGRRYAPVKDGSSPVGCPGRQPTGMDASTWRTHE